MLLKPEFPRNAHEHPRGVVYYHHLALERGAADVDNVYPVAVGVDVRVGACGFLDVSRGGYLHKTRVGDVVGLLDSVLRRYQLHLLV